MASFLDVALAAAGIRGGKVVEIVKIVGVNGDGSISSETPVSKTEPPAWPPCSSCGRTSGFTYSDEDPAVRCLCGEPRPALLAAPSCIDCRQPAAPEALFCDPCFQARKVIPLEELTRRREERRKRTIARLTGVPCGTCGKARWNVNARGDAFCLTCFEQRRNAR